MTTKDEFWEKDASEELDPEATPIKDRRVVTQPYDITIDSIVSQIKGKVLFLRPLSDRPKFQRQYVWPDKLASKLVESVLLKVPIPPCYLSENDNCELDVIDGQQRIYSLYRFVDNQFKLSGLEALPEYNGLAFYNLTSKLQRTIQTYTLRCVVITRDSHPEIKFEVFERLNTNTVPLNAQELRNCMSRGALNDLLRELSCGEYWLKIRGTKKPAKRLSDEEIILRYFSFQIQNIEDYRTPLKNWLNETARKGRRFSADEIDDLREKWETALYNSLQWFEPTRCFRRPGSKVINRALFDLIMRTATKTDQEIARTKCAEFRKAFDEIISNEEFQDLISRAVDHKSRTKKRFEMWDQKMDAIGL